MLARVLLVLLAGAPVSGSRGASYPSYYDADDVHSADFYDSYNDEIKFPQKLTTVVEATTCLKRRDLEHKRTLNHEEIIDVKGILNNILHGKKPGYLPGRRTARVRRTARDYTDSYDYLENSIDGQPEVSSGKGPVIKKWHPTDEVRKGSHEREYLDGRSRQATEEHWSFMYQPETSTYDKNDIVVEVRKMIPVRDGEVPRRSSIDFWRPTQEVQTWSTTEETVEKEDTMMYPVESTSYSNSDMQAEVRKLVQHWSSGSSVNPETSSYNDAAMREDVKQLIQQWSPSGNVQHQSLTSNVKHRGPAMAKGEMNQQTPGMQTKVSKLEAWSPILDHKHWSASGNIQHHIPSDNIQHSVPSDNVQHWSVPDNVQHQKPLMHVQHWNPPMNVQHQNLSMNIQHWSSSDNVSHRTTGNVQHWSPTIDVQQWNPIAADNKGNLPFTASETDTPITDELDTVGDYLEMRAGDLWEPNNSSTTPNVTETMTPKVTTITTPEVTTITTPEVTTTTTPTTDTPTTTTSTFAPTRSSSRLMDIDAIMDIISNLTYDYEWNLTEQFNKTIIEHGVPTCPWEKWGPGGAWTAVTNATTVYPWDFENTSVVSKCFVCGLRTPEIPRNAFCADAFAGDFLPLMPIDAQSRGKIAGFRKYCRYIDTQNYVENPDEPRAIYGRFTGGCAVRWTDVTGVYTQRTCRSKYRPLLGKHFASKRMAKLELALVNVENGCIISPMATLLPVSRGISLYARFHACVCSSNWCNRATLELASFNTLVTIVLSCWLVRHP